MKLYTQAFLSILILCLTCSCNEENMLLTEGDMLFLKHKGASMPVLVRGNFDSDVIILFLHGGAGGTSATHIEDFAGMIEEEYAVAYWDQRHAGSSQGNFDKEDLTIDLMAEDMQMVINMLKHKYGNDKKVFAMGHSWGVILGTYYLISQENQLQGAIFSNGAHSSEHEYSARMDYIRDLSREMLNEGLSLPADKIEIHGTVFRSLEEVITWCDENDPIQNYDQLKIQVELPDVVNGYVRRTYFQVPDALASVSGSELAFQSPYHPLVNWVNDLRTTQLINNFKNETSIQEFYDFTPEMSDITLPISLIWGKYDPIVGLEVAEDYFEVIGTSEENKELTVLENSGHSGLFRENIKFSQTLIDFIERHR